MLWAAYIFLSTFLSTCYKNPYILFWWEGPYCSVYLKVGPVFSLTTVFVNQGRLQCLGEKPYLYIISKWKIVISRQGSLKITYSDGLKKSKKNPFSICMHWRNSLWDIAQVWFTGHSDHIRMGWPHHDFEYSNEQGCPHGSDQVSNRVIWLLRQTK